MSRVSKYQESIGRFMANSSCLPYASGNLDPELSKLIEAFVDRSDKFVSILLLTVINNQNRKNKVNVQGYYAAAAVEFLSYLKWLEQHRKSLIGEFGEEVIESVPYRLSSSVLKSTLSNLEVSRRYISDVDRYQKLMSHVLDLVCDESPLDGKKVDLETRKATTKDNLYRFYLNKRPELQPKYLRVKLVEKGSLMRWYEDGVCRLFKVAVSLGWLLTNSNEKKMAGIEKLGRLFAIVYQIGNSFETVDEEIIAADRDNRLSTNYIVNVGLQQAYDDYMWYKQRLITELMLNDLYTKTVKEMIEKLDDGVDGFIETTSPDIKSSYSHLQSPLIAQP